MAPTIQGDQGGGTYNSPADWALSVLIGCKRSALDMEPLVDAGPAIEVATEGDHRFKSKVKANVAIITILISSFCGHGTWNAFPFRGNVVLKGHESGTQFSQLHQNCYFNPEMHNGLNQLNKLTVCD